jgi:hypothetical protein
MPTIVKFAKQLELEESWIMNHNHHHHEKVLVFKFRRMFQQQQNGLPKFC